MNSKAIQDPTHTHTRPHTQHDTHTHTHLVAFAPILYNSDIDRGGIRHTHTRTLCYAQKIHSHTQTLIIILALTHSHFSNNTENHTYLTAQNSLQRSPKSINVYVYQAQHEDHFRVL